METDRNPGEFKPKHERNKRERERDKREVDGRQARGKPRRKTIERQAEEKEQRVEDKSSIMRGPRHQQAGDKAKGRQLEDKRPRKGRQSEQRAAQGISR